MTLLSLWPSGLGQECQTLCILPYLTLTAFLPGISIWKWENWGYLRFCILHKFTFKAEQSFLKRVPTWIFTTSILPSDPKPSNSVLSRYHSHQYPLFLRENIQEGPFKSHRNSTPSSTLVSSSHSKTSSGSSQPLPFIFFESLTIFLAVLAHLWPNAFSLELIYDKMRIFKRHFSQKLREHNNFFFKLWNPRNKWVYRRLISFTYGTQIFPLMVLAGTVYMALNPYSYSWPQSCLSCMFNSHYWDSLPGKFGLVPPIGLVGFSVLSRTTCFFNLLVALIGGWGEVHFQITSWSWETLYLSWENYLGSWSHEWGKNFLT